MCSCQELAEIASDCVNIQESGVSKENGTELANFISSCGLEINELGQHLISVSGEIKANQNTHDQVTSASAPSTLSAASPDVETLSAGSPDADSQSEKPKRKASWNYVCTLCNKEFHLILSWYNHMKIHKNMTYVCSHEYCDYFCKSKSTFKEHSKYYHHKSKTVPCKVKWCVKMFQMPSDMFQHVRMHHK